MKRLVFAVLMVVGAAVLAAEDKIMLWPKPVEGKFQPYLELYLLGEGAKTPTGLVLVCPGGGYARRSKHEGEPIARVFNELGWHAAVLQYRVAPQASYPEPQRDALRAIGIIRANAEKWGIDKKEIAVLGFSAGGHLAACCGTIWKEIDASAGDDVDREEVRPDAMILCYPVINLTRGHAGSGKNLLGKQEPAFAELERLDLEKRVSAETPPAFLWHTVTDQLVPYESSTLFAEAMWKLGNTAELHMFPRGAHGLAIGQDNDIVEIRIWPELASAFLHTIGFVSAK